MVTVGMFDGVHLGHRHIVDRLGNEADARGLTPVVVTFDRHPRMVLGHTDGGFGLLSTTQERLKLLDEAGAKTVVVLDFTPQLAALSTCDFAEQVLYHQLGAQALLLGYDNQFGSKRVADFDRLPQRAASLGIELVNDSPLVVDNIAVSSTQVRSALANGDIALANRMLGRHYELGGVVTTGRQVGRTIGFPTANLVADDFKAVPLNGVYATLADIEGATFPAMTNIGPQPTFGTGHDTIEIHLIGFRGDLYNRRLTVRFVARLRNTQQFDSAQALASQLELDRQLTIKLCRQ